MKRMMLHITAGTDSWTPTQKELNALARQFRRARLNAATQFAPIVTTRDGVTATYIDLDAGNDAVDEFVHTVAKNIDAMKVQTAVFGNGTGEYRNGYVDGFRAAQKQARDVVSSAVLALGMKQQEKKDA
jgi:hypothetical protein